MSNEETHRVGFRSTWLGRALAWLWGLLRPPRRLSKVTRDWERAPHRPTEEEIDIADIVTLGRKHSWTPLYADQTRAWPSGSREDPVIVSVDPARPDLGPAYVVVEDGRMKYVYPEPEPFLTTKDWRRLLVEAAAEHQRLHPEQYPPRAHVEITSWVDPDVR